MSESLENGRITPHWIRVVLNIPTQDFFDYSYESLIPIGLRVIVPFGRRKLIGVVVDHPRQPSCEPTQVRLVEQVLDDLPAFADDWLRLAHFTSSYYQRPLGAIILPALPLALRRPAAYQNQRLVGGPVNRLAKRNAKNNSIKPNINQAPVLNSAQQQAIDTICSLQTSQPILLHGITGSGKTEVYLHVAQHILARGKQLLFMVPEINLTPQLEQALRARLRTFITHDQMVVIHSGLSDNQRLNAWISAQQGQAKVLLGTRLAVFTPFSNLGLIIVDEEHDTSYKQQDSLRYSARDLAIWRAHNIKIPIVLGSATPSLETWHHSETGRYLRLSLNERAGAGSLPTVKLIDTRRLTLRHGFSAPLVNAIEQCLSRKEQTLIFLNRRGYAPVLECISCGWMSKCPHCTVCMVLHRVVGQPNGLQCHHCGYRSIIPSACPECGDQDLRPMGRGTQRIEENLAEMFPNVQIARLDADSTRRKGSAQTIFEQMHSGQIDILVGTQMVAKGHDFAQLGLVGVLNADAMLFSHDFRASERLFAQLMQVGGRAGRHLAEAEVLIQTHYPNELVYQSIVRHDYLGFARHILRERKEIGLPPFAHQALLTAQAHEIAIAIDFLQQARTLLEDESIKILPGISAIVLYDPVPLRIVRVARIERAQLLIESASRPYLQIFLTAWLKLLPVLAKQTRVRWQIEVDPLEI